MALPTRPVPQARRLTPVASPVDRYVRPATASRSNLYDLAQGLVATASGMSNLKGFLGQREKEAEEEDRIRGEAAFNENHQADWATAVAEGKVPAYASPGFMQGYKNAQGNLSGLQLREQFRAEYMAWDGRNANDPEAYGKFVSEFVAKHVGEQDPEVLRTLNDHVKSLFSEGYEVFSRERADATYNGAVSTQGALAAETIQGIEAEGLSREDGTDYEAMWNSLVALREQALSTGIRTADYDKTLAQAVAAEAVRTNNTDLLKLFDRKLPGSEHAFGMFPESKALREQAEEAIAVNMRQAEAEGDRRQAKIDKAREESALRTITRMIASDPTVEVPEEAIAELEKYDPTARKKIVETRKVLMEGGALEDPAALLEITEQVREGADEAYLTAKVREGVIRDPATLRRFQDRVERYRRSRAKGNGILTSAATKRYLGTIRAKTLPDALLEVDVFGSQGMTQEGLQATHDFELALLEWEERNPNGSRFDRERYIQEAGTTILGRIDRTNPEAPLYLAPDETPPATAEPGPTREPEPEPQNAEHDEALSPILRRFSERQREHITAAARQLGVSPEVYARGVLARMQQLQQERDAEEAADAERARQDELEALELEQE